jgi:hypothetical protein
VDYFFEKYQKDSGIVDISSTSVQPSLFTSKVSEILHDDKKKTRFKKGKFLAELHQLSQIVKYAEPKLERAAEMRQKMMQSMQIDGGDGDEDSELWQAGEDDALGEGEILIREAQAALDKIAFLQ